MSTVAILLSLGLLMFLAYRGWSVIFVAPLLALMAVLLSGDAHLLLPTYTQVFMKAVGGYVITYFPLFLLGAVFGKLMDDSGAARSIAHGIVNKVGKNQAVLAIVLACAVLTYGGVSLFVVAFAVYPIGAALFREVNIPKRFVAGSIALGAFTFTMTALPGTPAIQNAIPMPFFKTDAFAAPILSTIAGIIILVLGMLWLNARVRKAMAAGEGYGIHKDDPVVDENTSYNLPSFFISIAPIFIVIILNYVFSKIVFPSMDLSYLSDAKYGAVANPASVIGIWAIIAALVVAILFMIGAFWQRWVSLMKTLNEGSYGSLLPILNTATEVGYGNVIASLAGFVIIRDLILNVSANPLISEAIAVNILAGITGSASGGMSIALGAMGDIFYQQAIAMKINPEVLHRVVAMACGGLDTLPHNGAVVTLLGITQLTHRQSYADIGMVSVIIPIAVTVVGIVLGTMGVV